MKYCSICNMEFSDASRFCTKCGAELSEAVVAHEIKFDDERAHDVKADNLRTEEIATRSVAAINRNIESHLIKSIIATICCCLPFGIVSIVYASRVKSLLETGNIDAALEASKKANLWSNVAIGLGVLQCLLWVLLYGAIFASMLPELNSLGY